MDPDEGAIDNKFLVFCNRSTNETCVYPKRPTVEEHEIIAKSGYTWIIRELMMEPEGIEYAASLPQIKMLQTLSRTARQNVTFECQNAHALKRADGSRHDRPLTFMTDTEQEQAVHQTTRKMTVFTLLDECAIQDSNWHKSIFEMTTRKSEHLPLFDIAHGEHMTEGVNKNFKLQIGPACFT